MSEANPADPALITALHVAAARATRSWPGKKFWISVVVTALGVGLAIAGQFHVAAHSPPRLTGARATHPIATYRIGDCVTLTTTRPGAPDMSKADCGADPSYTIGGLVQSDTACAAPDYIRYVWTVGDETIGTLCLAANLIAEHCYQPGPISNTLERVQCAAARGRSDEVAQRLDNVDDVTLCPPDTSAFAYPTPPRTYCLTPH